MALHDTTRFLRDGIHLCRGNGNHRRGIFTPYTTFNHAHNAHLQVGGAKRDPVLPPAQRHEAEGEDGVEEDGSAPRPEQKQDGGDHSEKADERGVRRVEEAAAAVEEGVEHAGGDQGGDPEQGDASHDEVA